MSERQPHDINAEQCVLGGMMLSKDAIADVLEVITNSADYYRPAHQIVHEVIVDLFGKGEPADAVTVFAELTRRGDVRRIGDPTYLHTLIQTVPTAANAGYYARIVAEKATLRRLIEVGSRIMQTGYEGTIEPDRAFDTARGWLDDAAGTGTELGGADIGTLAWEILGRLESGDSTEQHGLATGLVDLDSLLSGLRAGQFIVIAARPGAGKSALALNIAGHVATTLGLGVHFWSLEMSREELTLRHLSSEARVNLRQLIRRELDLFAWDRLAKASARISEAPLRIFTPARLGLTDIRAELRVAQRRGEMPRLVVVDYLQLMAGNRKAENRQQEVSELARGLKELSREYALPVVALAQLNRSPEHRSDKRPIVADLRESGEIENAADVIILLHRDDMYEAESARAGEADIIVGKHRNGPQATVTTAWQGEYVRFVDMAPI